jgi:serine phosphatase RsbU (regulator of sigma subunit)
LLERRWRESPQKVVDAIFEDLDWFADGTVTSDDETLVVMRVK